MSDYWRIFAEEVPSELGITLTEAQIESLAGMMEGAHENYGMAHGHDCIHGGTHGADGVSDRKVVVKETQA